MFVESQRVHIKVKDRGESVRELMIKRKQLQETVLSYLGVFTICTFSILICLLVYCC